MTTTRTYAILPVSAGTWAEVHDRLRAHGAIYGHAFVDHAGGPVIDMDGLALQATTEEDWTKRDSADGLVAAAEEASTQTTRANRADELLRDCLVFLDDIEERRVHGLLRVPMTDLNALQQKLTDHLPVAEPS